jgi:hypothetical protein
MKSINYVYKITNLINGKYYIGKHSTNDIDDNYFGSGVLIRKALKVHGKENFIKEVIAFCNTEEEALKLEEELVTMEVVRDQKSYNMITGGRGVVGEKNGFFGKRHTKDTRERMSKAKRPSGENSYRYGKKASEETKMKMRLASSKRVRKTKNVAQVDIESGDTIHIFKSTKEAAECFGKNNGVNIVASIINNGSAYGYKWKYIN